jgi:hypothetical protein
MNVEIGQSAICEPSTSVGAEWEREINAEWR